MKDINLFVKEIISELGLHQRTHVVDHGRMDREREENDDRPEIPKHERMSSDDQAWHLSNLESEELENKIELAMFDDECQSVDEYAMWADDEGVTTYDTVVLQAITRNRSGQPAPGKMLIDQTRKELESYGLKFKERSRVDVSRRGPTSSIHGTNRYANSGGGGSGFGPGGEIKGGTWTTSSPGALPMGSKRR